MKRGMLETVVIVLVFGVLFGGVSYVAFSDDAKLSLRGRVELRPESYVIDDTYHGFVFEQQAPVGLAIYAQDPVVDEEGVELLKTINMKYVQAGVETYYTDYCALVMSGAAGAKNGAGEWVNFDTDEDGDIDGEDTNFKYAPLIYLSSLHENYIGSGPLGISVFPSMDTYLSVKGSVLLKTAEDTEPQVGPQDVDDAMVYAWKSGGVTRLYAADSEGNHTILSSHASPHDNAADAAATSFEDTTVALPYSFAHKNVFIGKGQTIDMAKAMAYLEKQMQAELGEEAGRLIYTYDLPEAEIVTMEQWENAVLEKRVEMAMKELAYERPWVPVTLGRTKRFPRKSWKMFPRRFRSSSK